MKPKTALTIAALCLAVLLIPSTFTRIGQNQEILVQEFVYLGFSFSVIRALAFAIIGGMLFSSAYFTFLLYRQSHGKGAATVAEPSQAEQGGEAAQMVLHGRADQVLSLLAGKEDPGSLLLAAKARLAEGDWVGARPLLEASFPLNLEAGYLLAEGLQRFGESPLEVLNQIVAGNPDNALAAYRRLLAYQDSQGDWQACLDTVKTMQGKGFDLDETMILGYRYEWIRSQVDLPVNRVVEHYQKMLKQTPDFIPARLGLAETYLNSGSVDKAFRIYEQAFERSGDSVFLDRLEHYYLEQGRPEDAIQIYRHLLITKGGVLIKYKLGRLYFQLEMLDESLEMLEPLRETLAELPGFLTILAEIKARRNRPEDALADLFEATGKATPSGQTFICRQCQTSADSWRARCGGCGQWNQLTHQASQLGNTQMTQAPLYY